MDDEISRKELVKILLMCLLICGLSALMYFSYKQMKAKDMACYYYHTEECENCHKQNKTFLLCSGMCVDSKPDDENYGCMRIGLKSNCSEQVPKMCLT